MLLCDTEYEDVEMERNFRIIILDEMGSFVIL